MRCARRFPLLYNLYRLDPERPEKAPDKRGLVDIDKQVAEQ